MPLDTGLEMTNIQLLYIKYMGGLLQRENATSRKFTCCLEFWFSLTAKTEGSLYIIAALTWFKQMRHLLPLPVSEIRFFLLTKSKKNLLAKHYFVSSTILTALKNPDLKFCFSETLLPNNYDVKKMKKKVKRAQLKCCQNQVKN